MSRVIVVTDNIRRSMIDFREDHPRVERINQVTLKLKKTIYTFVHAEMDRVAGRGPCVYIIDWKSQRPMREEVYQYIKHREAAR